MGIKYFYFFLKENGCENPIKIEERISSFKKKHPDEKPIIVFDLNQMIPLLVRKTWLREVNTESYCGGRERKIINLAEDWFKKLTSLDCKLVFWCEGYKLWCAGENFTSHKKNRLKKCRTISKIFSKEILPSGFLKSVLKMVPIYFSGVTELAKMYGTLHFSVANSREKDVANYATKNNALAVVSSKSYMLIFDGSWELWNLKCGGSKFDSTTINKKKIQKHLKLNNLQMSLFGALNLIIAEGKNYKDSIPKFHLIASFLSENIKETNFCNILNDSVINPLISYLEKNELKQINRNDLIKAVESYNLEHMNVANCQQFPWLNEHTMESGTALYEILNALNISMTLLFTQGVPEFPTHLKNMKLRQIGLVRYSEWIKTNKKFHTTFHIFCNDYETYTEEPIYPLTPGSTISTILGYENQKLSIDQKLELAIWVIFGKNASSQWSIDFVIDLRNIIDTTFFVPKLVLTFLLKNNVITKTEANILAISLKISERNEHREFTNCPPMLHRRCIQVGYVYLYTIYSVSTSLKMCGLSKYCKSGYYDGFIFHNIHNKFFNGTENLQQLGDFSDLIL